MLYNKQQFNFFTLPFSGCCAYGLFMTDITNLPTPASRMLMSVQALPSNRPRMVEELRKSDDRGRPPFQTREREIISIGKKERKERTVERNQLSHCSAGAW